MTVQHSCSCSCSCCCSVAVLALITRLPHVACSCCSNELAKFVGINQSQRNASKLPHLATQLPQQQQHRQSLPGKHMHTLTHTHTHAYLSSLDNNLFSVKLKWMQIFGGVAKSFWLKWKRNCQVSCSPLSPTLCVCVCLCICVCASAHVITGVV